MVSPGGSAAGVQVAPPSVLASTTGPLASTPKAKQLDAVGQLMSLKGPVPAGRLPAVHVAPALVVVRTLPSSESLAPVATHAVAEEQSMASSSAVLAGTVWALQVVPLVVPTATPPAKSDPMPTAVQVVAAAQLTP